MGQRGVFAREATGIVREVSAIGATMSNVQVAGLGIAAFYMFMSTAWLWPGWDIPTFYLIVFVPIALQSIMYVIMGTQYPRSGGDYVWTSRILHPAVGFAMNWMYMLMLMMYVGAFADYVVAGGLSAFFTFGGQVYQSAQWATVASLLSQPTYRFLIGLVFIIIVGAILVIGIKWAMRVTIALFLVGIVTFAAQLYVFATTSQDAFIQAWNSSYGQYMTYDQIIAKARELGFVIAPTLGGAFAILAGGWETNCGYLYSTYYAGEIRQVKRSVPISVLGTIAISTIGYALASYLFQRSAGYEFITSSFYLFYAQKAVWTVPVAADPYIYALVASGFNPAFGFLIPLNVVIWYTALILSNWIAISRCVLAWSFDRILPTRLSVVNERFHTPHYAILFSGIIVTLGLLFSSSYAMILAGLNFRTTALIALVIPGIAALGFPKLRKDLYERADIVKKYKLGPYPLVSVLGLFVVAFFGITFAVVAGRPEFGGPPNMVVWLGIVALFGSALVIYYLSKMYWQRKGIDLALLFKEIPPE